ncbi:MAG: HEAT repeat domain-containing protein [Limisphaerales bacterium]
MTLKFRFLPWFVTSWAASLIAVGQVNAAGNETSAEIQAKLIGILQSGAPPQEKAITCKQLVVHGTKDAVPALAPLLADKELASWARIALEAIPDPAADEALRTAMATLHGRLLIGVINSLGVRRDALAVPGLVGKLRDGDPEVASAAAAALGGIGGEPAAKALEQALTGAPAGVIGEIADACVRCADGFLVTGKKAEAIRLYDTVRQSKVPRQNMLEATRGAILARGADGLPLLLEQLRSPEKALFEIGLRTARELPGSPVTAALAAEWERATPERQTLLVTVLEDRGDPSVLPTILKAAQAGPKPMRLIAVGALERMAGVAGVPVLIDVAMSEDRELVQAARGTLIRLPDDAVNADLLARFPQASPALRRLLIDLAGQRRIMEALPLAVRYAEDADPAVRSAAIGTIGMLGGETQAADLVRLLQKTTGAKERDDLARALASVTSGRGDTVLPALQPLTLSADRELRAIALHTLSGAGGRGSLAVVRTALDDQDEEIQDEAVRTLATWPGNWPDDSGVAEPLLALAKSGRKPSHQVLGLRGYLEYVQGTKQLSNPEKVSRIQEILPLAKRPEEKRLAITALSAAPGREALEALLTLGADTTVAEEAWMSVANLAGRDDLKGASRDLRQKSLQTVLQESKAEATRKKADAALKKLR